MLLEEPFQGELFSIAFFFLSVGHLNPYRRCSVAFYFFIFLFFKAFDVLSSVNPAVQFIRFCCLLAVSADVSRCFRVSADPEEDDAEVPHEGLHQHAQPLPLPVRLSPAGMDGLPLQHALLHRLHGTGIQNQCKLMIKGGGGEPFLQNHRKNSKLEMLFVFSDILSNLFLFSCQFVVFHSSFFWYLIQGRGCLFFKSFLFSEVVYLKITYI